jgi:hypothetical protein
MSAEINQKWNPLTHLRQRPGLVRENVFYLPKVIRKRKRSR